MIKEKYFQAIGRRKRSSALVKLSSGVGKLMINKKEIEAPDSAIILPLKLLGLEKKFDIMAQVKGGGIMSRKGAICLAIARALVKKDESNKPTLRKSGLLTRDQREKERKKPGLKRARRAPQWKKR
ncbi:30S ribosomal protein S9 [Candidatus Berkelbacteria bacterium CG_4_9_14_3_um_filter_39_23]|uniref:Small ribosomal subunit protein uS9 n=2 Tax=Candidatus Berkelbacteria TaxID=1618330 RepID=A0A2M7CII6_9BACT|nr:MAG: 30S ribosomal protein S9 [Candidatus Berkelbacteria bacterium CG2_30_39_44]PIR28116.1 MAG: 30S ribosomal protein S9 [Candidatus Berkelbacteria bacterium CG11_big_fil_rev_8_21_14_0_20_40_23]PIV25457.1 MAG: 30S ribosomal protein S9 [Candidatus Berkelbacteria bacterium CG03_land_8_20_14_0_80_40_36]PIX30422.1 MAG: 30S ribosomal protein S9 [Candidatus Berkelbacteria bacterium CG_4_8_14_3_um_filter_39_27]PIZ28912.1 MAG: 30S ribosomal protein S9 [Candidatus Berkelbacteria bacterium CG_4_10_14_